MHATTSTHEVLRRKLLGTLAIVMLWPSRCQYLLHSWASRCNGLEPFVGQSACSFSAGDTHHQ
jgi:hypothetical protein